MANTITWKQGPLTAQDMNRMNYGFRFFMRDPGARRFGHDDGDSLRTTSVSSGVILHDGDEISKQENERMSIYPLFHPSTFRIMRGYNVANNGLSCQRPFTQWPLCLEKKFNGFENAS